MKNELWKCKSQKVTKVCKKENDDDDDSTNSLKQH